MQIQISHSGSARCSRSFIRSADCKQQARRDYRVYAQGVEYFDEGAAQVKRLLDRDRKELANEARPKAEYEAEYDLPAASSSRDGSNSASSSKTSAIADELSSLKNPMEKAFKTAPKRGAFGSNTKSPFGSDDNDAFSSSNRGDMWAGLDAAEEEEVPWYKQISFGQVAIVLSFLTIIGLMLGTVWVTYRLGGVHFNE